MGGFIVKSKAEDLLLWEQRINEKTRIGITVDEWCKKNGFSRHKYYYWNHRISQKQKSDKEVIFAEVTSILSSADNNENFGKNKKHYSLFQKILKTKFLYYQWIHKLFVSHKCQRLRTERSRLFPAICNLFINDFKFWTIFFLLFTNNAIIDKIDLSAADI